MSVPLSEPRIRIPINDGQVACKGPKQAEAGLTLVQLYKGTTCAVDFVGVLYPRTRPLEDGGYPTQGPTLRFVSEDPI